MSFELLKFNLIHCVLVELTQPGWGKHCSQKSSNKWINEFQRLQMQTIKQSKNSSDTPKFCPCSIVSIDRPIVQPFFGIRWTIVGKLKTFQTYNCKQARLIWIFWYVRSAMDLCFFFCLLNVPKQKSYALCVNNVMTRKGVKVQYRFQPTVCR